jgi:Kef-type K+ transport system membrane component KefB
MGDNLTEIVTHLVLQLAVILFAAKLAAEVCERYLKIPPVLGELVAGIIIGPYALGGLTLFGAGPLFPLPHVGEALSAVPVSTELYSIAQVAVVILLFSVGLETDIRQFLRFAGPGALVALGGVVLPFFLGAWLTVVFGFAPHMGDPIALFMGAALTATSVGITARVLSDMGRLGTPEGVTILAGAVVDDVLGILVLTVVVGIAEAGSLSMGQVGGVTLKAVGFWVGLTGGGLLLARFISRFVGWFRTAGAGLGLALGLGFLAAAMAEQAGLAMIIGAYSIGLALSGTTLARRLEEPLRGVYNALVPIFFVVMGMMVDVSSMMGTLAFGGAITAAAILSKVVGAGLPALATGFNLRGASRIGIGMLPRGEVALIVAGIGLARGIVENELFGVAILMTVVTTLMAPPILVALFARGGDGRRRALKEAEDE